MTELIDKNEAKKEMWWLFNNYVNNASNFEPEETEAVNRAFGRLQSVIDNMPTTSEAEIKARVVDEFAKELKEALNQEFPLNYESTRPYFTLENARLIVDEIALQMKCQ